MGNYVSTLLGTAAVQGPTSKPTGDGQVASHNSDGSFVGWVTPGTGDVISSGVAGGQTLIGGTGPGDDLILRSSSHATKGVVQVRAATFEVVDEAGVKYTQIDQFGQARFSNVNAASFDVRQGGSYKAVQTTSIGVGMEQARWRGEWADNTHASRRGRMIHTVEDWAGRREAIRAESDGTQAMIGFLGADAVARPTVTGSWSDGTAGVSLAAALASLGLITDDTEE